MKFIILLMTLGFLLNPLQAKNKVTLNTIYYTFPKEIKDVKEFKTLIQLLRRAPKGYVLDMNISGVGGKVDITQDILYALKHTKAHIIMNVTGDVSSAHAFIAVSGHELKVNEYSTFMYHTSSIKGMSKRYSRRNLRYILTGKGSIFTRLIEWVLDSGTDRGIPISIKMKNDEKASLKDTIDLITSFKVLTKKELVLIDEGHDVYIEAEEIKKRFDKK